MRVALIGLGDIARKAYLPVLAADGRIEPVLVTRDPTVRRELSRTWRVPEAYERVEDVLGAGVDAAFVHAATPSHPPLVTALIDAGVPTLVDKPLAESYEEAATLVELADRRQVGLVVGFNRRFAPAYRDVASWPDLDVALLHKHRRGQPAPPRRVVFDDFIHVVDALRLLMGGSSRVDVSARVMDGLLHRVLLRIDEGSRTGIGIMDRASGTTQEVLEVSAPGRRRRIVEMAEVTHHQDGVEAVTRRDEWTPVAAQRGFAAMCEDFLEAVQSGRRLDASDALETHRLCEHVVSEVERSAS